MNKLCIPLLIVLLALAGCSKDPSETPAPEMYITSVTARMKFSNEKNPYGYIKWGSETYAPDGLLLEREYREDYDLDGPMYLLAKETNTYENGVLNEQEVLSPRTNNTKYVYTYSNNRLAVKEEYDNSGILYTTYKYEYNGSELPSRMLQYFPSVNGPYLTHTYTYNAMGKVTKERVVYFNNVEHTIETEYDEKGNLTKQTVDAPGRDAPYINKLANYTYDAKGRIMEREFSTYLDMDFQKWVYSYYENDKGGRNDKINSIMVYVATLPNVYELKGIILFEYTYDVKK